MASQVSQSQGITKKAPEGAKEVERFFGVYLLYCTNPKFRGRTYIGKTTDPNRRIFQHNHGKVAGGAWRTSNRGPWDMVLVVHGFPNDISALRFEWAWQHPKSSRRLNSLPGKKSSEKRFDYELRLLACMLRMGPWDRLPLTIQWLLPDYQRDFPPTLEPPLHMPICLGPVKSTKPTSGKSKTKSVESDEEEAAQSVEEEEELLCNLCFQSATPSQRLVCLYPRCGAVTHTICLGEHFVSGTNELVPVSGRCPTCEGQELWGDLIKKKRGCYSQVVEQLPLVEEEEEESY